MACTTGSATARKEAAGSSSGCRRNGRRSQQEKVTTTRPPPSLLSQSGKRSQAPRAERFQIAGSATTQQPYQGIRRRAQNTEFGTLPHRQADSSRPRDE